MTGMKILWDVPVPMGDGISLRADIFMPDGQGPFPVILSMGAYGKGLAFQDGFTNSWNDMVQAMPEIMAGSSGAFQVWEVADPERWLPEGYACMRVDSRGAGRSPGVLDVWSPREAHDLYECIEWAAHQPWSSGKVGLLGISYLAMNQWYAASLKPPHLSAICVWEGAADYYRDVARHGGIYCQFIGRWFPRQVTTVQHGVGDRGPRSRFTGETVAGPETLSQEELARSRVDPEAEILARPLDGDYYRERSPNYDAITVPLLSAANWGGQGLHPRGNFEGFMAARSDQKWLQVHGGNHFFAFYSDEGVALQKRFFGHFLKGDRTGWENQPTVDLQIRHVDGTFTRRAESEWPLARTRWTKFYLNSAERGLSKTYASGPPIAYATRGNGCTFVSAPFTEETEITGPSAVRLVVSSDTTDADVFAVLQVLDGDGNEIVFQGSDDPRTPLANGWLRASHRKLDPARSLPYRPYHSHDETMPLTPGLPVRLDIEIWPTCVVVPAGYRIALMVRGIDYRNDQPPTPGGCFPMQGVGPFVHDDERDRPRAIFDGTNTLHFEPDAESFVLLPIIPPAP